MNHIDDIEFKNRLRSILKLRYRLTRKELLNVLNLFWKHNKKMLGSLEIQHQCYSTLVKLLRCFDDIIEISNRRYYYCYSKRLIELVK